MSMSTSSTTPALKAMHVIKAKGIAGAERHILSLLQEMRARGIDARLILLEPPDHSADAMADEVTRRGIPLQRVEIARHVAPGMFGTLRAIFLQEQPDIVHTHLQHADLYGIVAARLSGVKIVVSTRHNDDPARRRLPVRLLNASLARWATAVITISEALRHFALEVEWIPPRKLHTILYGLPLPVPKIDRGEARRALRRELGVPDSTLLIGMASRLIEQKGITYALQAYTQIEAEFPQARVVIAGDGPLRAELQAQAGPGVHFVGWRTDVLHFLAGLDVFLAPSLWEGFGLVLLEAMGQQLPIIGSTASAIPEVIVHGETGLLVPPADPTAIADALRVLLNDKPLRMHLGLVGADRLETHFSATQMVDKTLALYRKLADRKLAE